MTELFVHKKKAYSHWVEVILPLALPKIYTYALPNDLFPLAVPGKRAEVVFGRNRKYAGIINRIIDEEPKFETREIISILDDLPLLNPEQLQFWDWIAKYYMCSEGEVMIAALPAHFKLSSETILVYNEEAGDDFSFLNDDEFIIAEGLLIKNQLSVSDVQELLGNRNVYQVVKSLLEKKICFAWEKIEEKYKPRKEKFITLNPQYTEEPAMEALLNNWKGAPRQLDLLLAYLHILHTETEVSQTALLKKAGATAAQLKGLVEKGILFSDTRIINRLPNELPRVNIDFSLSAVQEKAFREIKDCFNFHSVCLLHAVTGSGKTHIYIRLIEEYLAKGKQVLYLLPEIALTTQIVRRLQKHFGGYLSVYHSKFNDQEKVEIWNRVRSGEAKIILGARSAIFLPFTNLGFIVVDEEHDGSYKQNDRSPRYNARDAAIYYSSLFNAKLLLGSATPSLESFYNAQNNKFGLVELTERYGHVALPAIEIINARQVAVKGKLMISPQLHQAIEETVRADKQVILFQNRRGYNPYLICASCGYIPKCIHCDVSLTLHKNTNKLHCHYCGTTYPKLVTCPACGSNTWLEKNFGTEKIEELLEEEFPDFKVARMDIDSVKGKHAHDLLIHQFERQDIDILVGTQMVVKGLDFEKVQLVAILDADSLLSFADFRVNERAYQLMEQVSGRAGRKFEQGRVIIQAINVQHPVLDMVREHDFQKMAHFELPNRKQFNYPPFSRLIKLTLKHKQRELLDRAASQLVIELQISLKDWVIGPAIPPIGRIRGFYLSEILIKIPKTAGNNQGIKTAIRNCINLLITEKQFRTVQVIVDVDPN
ncbi:MAG: primosomal protein N' [Chitinophagaceae bacterium]|nr:primosomal protein N' [Chitinophagaceae bacterium]